MGVETMMIMAAALSAGSAIMQGQQANDTADVNAELLRRQGDADKDAAAAESAKIRKAARAQAGEANAALAASGVSIGDGTAVRINEQIYRDAESDAASTMLTGVRRARSAEDQAGFAEWQGKNAQTAGYLNAGASLLSAGATVGKGWTSVSKTSTAPLGSGLRGPSTGFWGK